MFPNRNHHNAAKARAELHRYEAWLAKHACQPAPTYHHPGFSTYYAVDPDGVMIVLYYSRGPESAPSHRQWLVPQAVATGRQ